MILIESLISENYRASHFIGLKSGAHSILSPPPQASQTPSFLLEPHSALIAKTRPIAALMAESAKQASKQASKQ
jgi:hypothetical protein